MSREDPLPSERTAWAAAGRATGARLGEHNTSFKPMLWQNSIEAESPPCNPQIHSLIEGFTSFASRTQISFSRPTLKSYSSVKCSSRH